MKPAPVAPHRDNAFDLLRLILAVMVVYSHACFLGGFGTERFALFCHGQTTAGTLAVIGFFGISGFLVTRSFAVRGNLLKFAKARLLRIVPGFYFALLFTAFCLAPLISHFNTLGAAWKLSAAFHFVEMNALVRIVEWHVGGVLHGLPYDGSIDGALWSLYPELCCYGLVALFGVAKWIQSGRVNILVFGVSLLLLNAGIVIAPKVHEIAPTILQLTEWTPFVTAFVVGSLASCYREQLEPGWTSAALWMLIVLALLKFGGWALLGPLVLPIGLIRVAQSFSAALPADLSYGTYVLHFPILQLLAALGLNHDGFFLFFTTGLVLALGLATVSWFGIERPFLRLKS